MCLREAIWTPGHRTLDSRTPPGSDQCRPMIHQHCLLKTAQIKWYVKSQTFGNNSHDHDLHCVYKSRFPKNAWSSLDHYFGKSCTTIQAEMNRFQDMKTATFVNWPENIWPIESLQRSESCCVRKCKIRVLCADTKLDFTTRKCVRNATNS